MNFYIVMHLSAFQLKRENFAQILAIVSLRTKLELLKIFEQYYVSKIGKARFLLQYREKIIVISSLNKD